MNHIAKDRRISRVFISAALSALLAVSGCSSSSDGDGGGGGGSGGGGGGGGGDGSGSGSGACLPLAVPAMPGLGPIIHTGYNGTDEFVAPILGNFTADAWSIADSSVATVEAFSDCNLIPTRPNPITAAYPHVVAIVHPKKPGESKVTGTIGGQKFTVNISVTNYPADVIALGKKRYYEPDSPSATRKACSGCHQMTGGPDHSPTAVAYLDDAVIRTIATTGKVPACLSLVTGSECTCGQPNCAPVPENMRTLNVPGGHTWEFTPAELAAIVPYLRSLPLKQR